MYRYTCFIIFQVEGGAVREVDEMKNNCKNFIIALLFGGCLLGLSSMEPNYKKRLERLYRGSVPFITAPQLKGLLDEGLELYLLDIRNPEEYAVSHIKGAVPLDYEGFRLESVDHIPLDAPVILYCSIGFRSERVGEILQKAGYQRVFNLYGGLFEWVNLGYPLYSAGGPTDRVHGYSRGWSRWLKRGTVVF